MKTKLFYFTGTGNSLSVARKLSAKLKNVELISIPTLMNDKSEISGEAIGIISPIYMHNMPLIVTDFITKIKSADYLFFVYTGAGDMGKGDKIVRNHVSRNNLKLSALFNVAMPSNYTPYGCPPLEKQKKLFAAAESRIDEIAEIITAKKAHFDKNSTGFFQKYIYPGLFYKLGHKFINKMDGSFKLDEKCNSCGICEKVCPVNNVKLNDGKPEWMGNCQQCFACFQWCPEKAIQYGDKTVDIDRYHNPKIKVKEIIAGTPEGK